MSTATIPTLRRPATRDHLRSKPRSKLVVEVHLDPETVQALAEADEAIGKALLRVTESPKPAGADKALKQAQEARDAAKAALDETTEEILLQSVGRKRYEDIQRQHPPTDRQLEEWAEQVEKADEKYRHLIQRPPHDVDTFAVALLAASAVEPTLTEDDVNAILDEWSPAEGMRLKMAVFQVNNGSELVGLGKASFSNGSNGTRG